MNPGYIYILQNPSLDETHLKIGRTTRDPDERAAEISSSTGVPTPFEVAWWSESVDCHRAESILHHHLTPYRTNTAREFFELDLDEAIRFARGAIRESGGRTGGLAYLLRRSVDWIFHGIIRPLLRLPVQTVLLAGLLTWWAVKFSTLAAWYLVRLLLGTFSGIFSALFGSTPSRKRKRRR
ncbi:MAG: GIY-YIG nuclease family protein [Verrucomicrobiales bacterium]|nr:GIY-YIG nuclease family protein [Verrucomicrobiales bacterium]